MYAQVLVFGFFTAQVAHADEGMWLPEQLPAKQQELEAMGLALSADALSDPMGQPLGSIVTLGFCSASFISPDGLIATNHHCVQGYLQYLSDAENNRNVDGYLAPTRDEELWVGPGSEVQVVEKITDVTDQVFAGVRRRTKDVRREAMVARNTKEIIAACEEGRDDVRCRVASYFGGAQFRLIEKRRLRDVRLVYAPPESVGSYGGEIDNWMWPRHSGDFALLRAYVSPKGEAAEHDSENVAYQPPHHLEVNAAGVAPGEFVMVAGYPGSTYRFRPARSMRFARDESYPFSIELSERIRTVLQRHADESAEAAARLAAPIGYIDNGLKYRRGMLDGFSGTDVVQRKELEEEGLMRWIAQDRSRANRYGPVFAEMESLADVAEQRYRSNSLVRWMLSADLLSAAHTAWRWASEQPKADLERDRGYQDRDRERIERRFERINESIWLPADRDVLALLFQIIDGLPEDQQPKAVLDWIDAQGGAEAALQRLFDGPALSDTGARLALLDQSVEELAASEDPWVELAIAADEWEAAERTRRKADRGANLRLRPLHFEALQAHASGEIYPDANGTLRVTVGHVQGYAPQDGLWALPQTTLAGMVRKVGEAPFDAPEDVVAAASRSAESRWFDEALGDVPVNYLTTLDSTGGNSGSATLDAEGRFVGLLFDGNYEAMTADWLFDAEMTRSIHVDVRYLLWMLDEVEGAQRLLEELGVAAE